MAPRLLRMDRLRRSRTMDSLNRLIRRSRRTVSHRLSRSMASIRPSLPMDSSLPSVFLLHRRGLIPSLSSVLVILSAPMDKARLPSLR